MLKEQNLALIRNELDAIIEKIDQQAHEQIALHEVEQGILRSLLVLGLSLLRYYILVCSGIVKKECRTNLQNKGQQNRCYLSVFGELSIERTKYYSQGLGVNYPLDAYLQLPAGKYSYFVSDLLSYGATEADFTQSCELLNRILGGHFSGMQSRRCLTKLSSEVESFYEQTPVEEVKPSEYLSVGFDGKGVPILLSELGKSTESSALRLSKGKKRGCKKEASISLSSSFTPRSRSADDIITSLFDKKIPDKGEQDKHHWHEQKHLRAFIADKPRAVGYGLGNLVARDPQRQTPIVVLMDGDRALKRQVKIQAEEMGIAHRIEAYILDFIHLLEYVWKVANAHLGEEHVGRLQWVRQQAKRLLEGQHQKVKEQWEKINQQGLSKNQKQNLQAAITYLTNKEDMIDYKTYLKKGFPITTGAVESACGHFVKSRMERNAMHWGFSGAQNALNLRAVNKNGDWNQYMKFFIEKEQKKLYKKGA